MGGSSGTRSNYQTDPRGSGRLNAPPPPLFAAFFWTLSPPPTLSVLPLPLGPLIGLVILSSSVPILCPSGPFFISRGPWPFQSFLSQVPFLCGSMLNPLLHPFIYLYPYVRYTSLLPPPPPHFVPYSSPLALNPLDGTDYARAHVSLGLRGRQYRGSHSNRLCSGYGRFPQDPPHTHTRKHTGRGARLGGAAVSRP